MTNAVADPRDDPTDPAGWLDRHGDYLYRFALARVRQPDAAEDLVQETLLAAWAGRAGFAGRAAERSWLTAILKRKAVDWLRRRVRERAYLESAASPDPATAGRFTARGKWRERPPAWADPGGGLARAEFHAAVAACLGRLPPRLREVFTLRHLDETAGDEVCRELGLTPANLWVMLHRARLRLGGCLTETWSRDTPRADRP